MIRQWPWQRILVLFLLLVLCSVASAGADVRAEGPYKPDWESLKNHQPAPDWFRDAKFGIYFHWGVYSVPAYGSEWYPRNMHLERAREYRHHAEKYGKQSEYTYADFVPRFKAEKFDADEWAELFQKAGARFAGPVAEHHDGFAMWDSKVTPWNAKARGPKRDITGELARAIRKRGMKFVATFHHARNSLWLKNGKWSGHYEGAKTNFPEVLEKPEVAFMYGYMPREKFLDMWLAKLVEVIDQYQPDLIWFDSWLDEIPDAYITAYLAYYFNRAKQWNREVVMTFKQKDVSQEIGVLDLEKGRMNKLTDFTWLTDDTISKGSWCYTDNLQIKSLPQVLHVLIDIVSKNGQLLLNISPKADGTIPEEQQAVLLGIGDWLKVNGEAIYDTRPWVTFGEGPTRLKRGGGFTHHHSGYLRYSSEDIRYTRKGDTLYAICLGWPSAPVTLQYPQIDDVGDGAKVSLLGYKGKVNYSLADKQLTIELPAVEQDALPCKNAFVFKLEGFKIGLNENVIDEFLTKTVLKAGQAVLEGDKINLENKYGSETIGFWDNSEEKIHWLVKIKEAGTYTFRGDFATQGTSALSLNVCGQALKCSVNNTGGWGTFKTVDMGKAVFKKAGVYHCILQAADPKAWRAVNVRQIQAIRTGPSM